KRHSTCTGGCAHTWPPLTTTGTPRAGSGITKSRLSTLLRHDGTRQVVYNGHPLYYYSGDTKAGQAHGQCQTFPAPWYVLTSSGTPHTKCSAGGGGGGGSHSCTPRPSDGVVSTATKAGVGEVIVDSAGCTLYEYTADPPNSTTAHCTGSCAVAWPLMTSSATPTATGNAQSGLLGKNANNQITYNGHPLYYFTSDARSSNASGEGDYVAPGYFYVLDHNGNQA
ncbi:MAG: hypothetical protein JO222_03910, partial [Frankiales bacterium]|nr:hypothetical protein [Frankiales bacterium]